MDESTKAAFKLAAKELKRKKKAGPPEREHLEKWVQTPDDWYPSFSKPEWTGPQDPAQRGKGGFVLVRFSHLSDGLYRVSVWGADDTGMELDLKSRMEALALYKILPNPVTKLELCALGFHPA